MEDSLYKDMIQRAEFFPATSRTAEGVHGLAFSKAPQINVDENLMSYLDNVDGKGHDWVKFTNDGTWEEMITNWGGVLIDAPFGEGLSVLEAEERKILPFCSFYRAEQIINTQTETVGRQEILKLVVLEIKENVPIDGDKYSTQEKTRYRVLELEDGIYKHSLLDEEGKELEVSYPTKGGKKLNYIPFFMKDLVPFKPIFKDLADVNISWFQLSAEHRNGLHWVGFPTPFVVGYQPETKVVQKPDGTVEEIAVNTLTLGGNKIAYLPQGATMSYLELHGNGINHIVAEKDKVEERMAILGAKIISQERKGVESAETAKIHRAGENSVIATFCNECSKMFTAVFKEYLEWCTGNEIPDDFNIRINTDYDLSNMSSGELTALVSCWQAGGISKRILFNNLQKGEVIDSETTFEQMEDEVEEEREQNLMKQVEMANLLPQNN